MDERLEPVTFGQGSYGYRCSVCGADDYSGAVQHRPGCGRLAPAVLALRQDDSPEKSDPD